MSDRYPWDTTAGAANASRTTSATSATSALALAPSAELPLVVNDQGQATDDYWEAAGLRHLEAEQRLLGMLIAEAGDYGARRGAAMLETVAGRLGTEANVFTHLFHRYVYAAALELGARNTPADLVAVDNELRRRNTPDYQVADLLELTTVAARYSLAPGADVVEGLCQDILDAAGRRQLLDLAQKLAMHAASGTPVADVVERTGKALTYVRQPHVGPDNTMEAVGQAYAQHVAEWRAKPFALRGPTTGNKALDDMTLGLRDGDLVVIGARMSMGKTLVALDMANAQAEAIYQRSERVRHRVGFMSLEMTCEALLHRLVAARTGIDHERILKGDPSLDWERIEDAIGEVTARPMVWVDNAGAANRVNGLGGQMTPENIRRVALAWSQEQPLEALYIDFLERIAPSPTMARASREEQLANIVGQLKNLAAELHIPVVLLAQLNRENERAGDRVPQLHHLRGSDAIAQLADLILFPVFWDYYQVRGMEVPKEVRYKPKGYGEIHVSKQRMGRTGAVACYVSYRLSKVFDWSELNNCPTDYQGRALPGWSAEYWYDPSEQESDDEDGDQADTRRGGGSTSGKGGSRRRGW